MAYLFTLMGQVYQVVQKHGNEHTVSLCDETLQITLNLFYVPTRSFSSVWLSACVSFIPHNTISILFPNERLIITTLMEGSWQLISIRWRFKGGSTSSSVTS